MVFMFNPFVKIHVTKKHPDRRPCLQNSKKKKKETKPMSDFNKDKEEGALTFDRGWKWSFSTLKLIEFSLGVVGETPSLN